MARNWDEPFGLYGLLAESIETGPEREWVEFTLRPEARFSDGTPVTVEDVIWSMETLAEKGLPRYRNAWEKVAKVEQTGERSVRFTFSAADSELPLIIGLRPILKKADWEGIDFAESSLRVPVGSGPYTIAEFEPGRFVTFARNADYWGKDLPINRGVNNFDTVRYDYFVDAGVLFQAFTAGELSVYRELSPTKWASAYGFPAVASGEIVKAEIPHGRPSGMEGFVFNTRRPIFQDWRVRDALLHAFNFEFINQTLNGGAFPRRASYFANSELGMGTGPAEGRVQELLEPFADGLVPGALDAYALPASDGSERNRANMRAAAKAARGGGVEGRGRGAAERGGGAVQLRDPADGGAERGGGEHLHRRAAAARDRGAGEAGRPGAVQCAEERLRLRHGGEHLEHVALARERADALLGEGRGDGAGDAELHGHRQPGGGGDDRRHAGDAGSGGVPGGGAGARPGADDGALRDSVLVLGPEPLAYKAELAYPEHVPVYGDWIGWLPEVWWHE